MASVVSENGSPSEEAFFLNIVIYKNPIWKKIWDTLDEDGKNALSNQARTGALQMSNILEQTISMVSEEVSDIKLKNVNIEGMDFDDGSDLKTFSLTYGPNGTSNGRQNYGLTGNISGMKNKKGAIRAICWNSMLEEVEYYFIPAHRVRTLSTSSSSIRLSASVKTGVVEKLQRYRLDNIEELSSARQDKMNFVQTL